MAEQRDSNIEELILEFRRLLLWGSSPELAHDVLKVRYGTRMVPLQAAKAWAKEFWAKLDEAEGEGALFWKFWEVPSDEAQLAIELIRQAVEHGWFYYGRLFTKTFVERMLHLRRSCPDLPPPLICPLVVLITTVPAPDDYRFLGESWDEAIMRFCIYRPWAGKEAWEYYQYAAYCDGARRILYASRDQGRWRVSLHVVRPPIELSPEHA